METGFVLRENHYYDSVFLMTVTRRISESDGVSQSAVVMATEANKKVLADIGISDPRIDDAGPGDMVAAVIGDARGLVDAVLANLDAYLEGGVEAASTSNPHTTEDGLSRAPDANLVVITVPGEYAAREATRAIEAGRNVFLFSDNVSVDDEVRLKTMASASGLVVMGPDCGTALINGVGVGFTNVVRRGPIGAIAASGTGLQEFSCQVHNRGSGISHGIGTGGRDLSDAVGGLTTLAAIDGLETDPGTRVIAILSKPPGRKTMSRISERLRTCTKPAVVCYLGESAEAGDDSPFVRVSTIDDAVDQALALAGGTRSGEDAASEPTNAGGTDFRPLWNVDQKYLRGVFAGGTFCYQSQQVLRESGISVHSNAPLDVDMKLSDSDRSVEHSIVDMGADEYTTGRPHPMIDGTARYQRVLTEAQDPGTAVLLLDFILGYNSSPDPVGDLHGAIVLARDNVRQRGGDLVVVASVCGTDDDHQGRAQQISKLEGAGVIVFESNCEATRYCASLLGDRGTS